MQHFLVLIGERYVFKPDVACRRGLPFPFHFRLVHQRKDASSGNGEIAEFGKVGQGGSQRVEHTGADHEEQHEDKQRKFPSQQEVCTAQDHQRQPGTNQRDAQQDEGTQQGFLTDAGTAQPGKGFAQPDETVAQQVVGFHHPDALQVFFQPVSGIYFGLNLRAAQFSLYACAGPQYEHGQRKRGKHADCHSPVYPDQRSKSQYGHDHGTHQLGQVV